MERDRPGPPPTPWPRGPARGAVRVTPKEGTLEVVLERGFTAEDVAAVKAIPGRRWFPHRLVWTVPDTARSWDALTEALGRRLVVIAEPDRSPEADHARDYDHHLDDRNPLDADALLGEVRKATRTRGYSWRTEKAYVGWVRRFASFHAGMGVQVEELNGSHARRFLEHLAIDERLAPGSRNQAASALAFMFKAVQGRDEMGDVPRAKGPKRAPLVLTHREVLRVLRELSGKHFLIAVLLYSAGLRLDECLRLRVKDVDFELQQILVRDGKGRKDRYVPLARRAQTRSGHRSDAWPSFTPATAPPATAGPSSPAPCTARTPQPGTNWPGSTSSRPPPFTTTRPRAGKGAGPCTPQPSRER
jgi:integrase